MICRSDGGEKIVRIQKQKMSFSERTKRTKRTKSFVFKACVSYVQNLRRTFVVRSKSASYTVEALILLGFVRFVRSVRDFLYTHIYRTYIFTKIKASVPARVGYISRTYKTYKTYIALDFQGLRVVRSAFWNVQNRTGTYKMMIKEVML